MGAAPPIRERRAANDVSAGLVSLDGRRLAFARLTGSDRSPEGPSPTAVNANDWVIVASTRGTPAAWSGPWAAGPVALTVAGLLALALAGAGYTRHHRQLHNRARTDDNATYAEEHDTHSLVKLGLEAALLTAIEHRQLVLYYQPALDPATGQVHRVEALVRWQHPDLGLIPPNDFVPLAEETGLSHPLTRLVLEMALDQTAQWHAGGLALQVSVNLSPANCTDPQLPDEVAAMLAARNLPPAALRLEVTEHAALDPSAEQVLTRLHHLGVSLALDDFGTGFSSLSHLRRLPVADIKIDRSFIAALADDPTDTVIIRSTIDIAHGLGCTVTAEGVEDEHTVHGLYRLGVDTIQGYHVCRPIPAGELRRWLQQTPQVRRTA